MLLVGAGLGVPSLSGLCIPGSIVTILGLLLLLMIQNSFDLWSTWAYAWTLVVLVGTGAGLAIPFLLIAAGAALVAWNRVAQTSPSRQEAPLRRWRCQTEPPAVAFVRSGKSQPLPCDPSLLRRCAYRPEYGSRRQGHLDICSILIWRRIQDLEHLIADPSVPGACSLADLSNSSA